MSFDAIQQEIKTSPDKITIEQISKFQKLCIDSFTESIDLSKGNPQYFMSIMDILTTISNNLTSKLNEQGDEKFWFILAKVSIELLMFKECNTFSDIVLKFNDKNKQAWYFKGRCYEKEKNFTKAEESFNKAIKIDDQFYMAWFQIASMYEKIDLESSYQKYLKIVEKFPLSMSGWKRLEEVGGKLGHFEVARKAQKVSFDLSNNPKRTM